MDEVSLRFDWLIQSFFRFIPYFIGGLVISSIVLAIGVFLARYLFWKWLLPVEKSILLFFNEHTNPLWTSLMVIGSFLAQGQVTIPLFIMIGGFLLYWHATAAVLILAIALGGSWLLNGIFKAFFRRQRPNLWASPDRPMDFSYPSGHSMSAISFYGLLAFYTSYFVAVPLSVTVAIALAISLWVGLSRVYLGVHWPTDVLSGWLTGSIWLITCFYGLVKIGGL
ncbi:MAG: phosphatase PAP2 family protein [Snowella sp.]|nr:phosphatase PAP2 family protein [Snowella sp.]